MRDTFSSDSVIDSPTRESVKIIDGCYNSNIFKAKPFLSSRRALQSSAEKISKTFKSVRNTFGNLSQHFRVSGRRRHRLAEAGSPCKGPSTPVTKKKGLLGRSPAKLYSPFGIETPHSRDFRMSPYMPDTPDGLSPKRRAGVSQSWHLLAKKRPRALFR
ncbi:PREDICTED: uncharacterized protein LOC106109033 [Papilio polytes]|uniref:uncharacterized protein LOC106109033 n=1 Tax=Papilio polytes TaxID=76194 RepID=UPI000675F21E|nr:PREDICTED: uncharacterized protein LOC106109033 [Papilio polytes]